MPNRYSCLIGLIILALLFGNLMGCAATRQTLPPVAEKSPPQEQMLIEAQPAMPAEHNGSLYAVQSSFNDFFIDTKARKVGDIVTIKIEESSKATNAADTKAALVALEDSSIFIVTISPTLRALVSMKKSLKLLWTA